MKNKSLQGIAALTALLLLYGCAAQPEDGLHSADTPPAVSETPAPVITDTIPDGTKPTDGEEPDVPDDAENPAGAYIAVFESLYASDPAINNGIVYIAVDLTNVIMRDTAPLVAYLQDFCSETGKTLLLDTFDGLSEKGYITDVYFEQGILFTFKDMESTDEVLMTTARKWRSGLGAVSAFYDVRNQNGVWEIMPIESMSVS